MRKKILLMVVMLAALVCALSLSISATTIYKDESGTELLECEIADSYHIASYEVKNGGFAKADAEGNALTWYLISTTTEGGNTVKTVACKKTSEVFANGAYTNGVDKLMVVSASWDEGITTVPAFGAWSSGYSKEILFVYIPDSVTVLPQRLFQNASVIKCEIKPSSNIKEINLYMLYQAKSIREIYFPASLEKIKDGTELCIGASRLEKATFDPNCKLTEIPPSMFQNCSSLKSVTFPNTVTTVGSRTFQGCSSLEYINLGASLTYMEKTSNNHSFAFQCPNMKTVIIPKTFVASNIDETLDYAFQTNWSTSNAVKFYYTGTEEEFKALQAKFSKAGNNSEICGATVENGRLILVNHCETFYGGEHSYKENPCVKLCERCGIKESQEIQAHNNTVELSYTNGYGNVGLMVTACTNEGCGHKASDSTLPIFILLGYSVSEDGAQLCAGFTINYNLLELYTSKDNLAEHPDKIAYGVVGAVGENTLSPLTVNNGSVDIAEGKIGIFAGLEDKAQVRSISLKINGQGLWQQNLDLAVAMNMYIYDGKQIYYLGDDSAALETTVITYREYME